VEKIPKLPSHIRVIISPAHSPPCTPLQHEALACTVHEALACTVHEALVCTVHKALACTVYEALACTVHKALACTVRKDILNVSFPKRAIALCPITIVAAVLEIFSKQKSIFVFLFISHIGLCNRGQPVLSRQSSYDGQVWPMA
jgi:uncharacterized membrane protein YwaF